MTASIAPSVAETFDIPALLRLLQRQNELYQQLQALSPQQSALVDQGSAESLLSVLSQRQQLIDELSQVNQSLAPYRDNWPHVWRCVPEAVRPKVNELLASIDTMLKAIIDQDERDRRQLAAAKQQVGRELSRINHAGTAMNAYRRSTGAPAVSPSPRFTDNKA